MQITRRILSVCLASVLGANAWAVRAQQDATRSTGELQSASVTADSVLEAAAGALADKRSVRYEARYEGRFGPAQDSVRRSLKGVVHMALPQSELEPPGVRVRIEAMLSEEESDSPELPFALSSDGATVRLRIDLPDDPTERIVWEARLPGPGAELLGMGDALRVEGMLTPDYLRADPEVQLSLLPDQSVAGVACRKVLVLHGSTPDGSVAEEWLIGVEDHLPREIRRSYASKGVEVHELLSLDRISFPSEFAAGFFLLTPPEGWRLEPYGDTHHHPDTLVAVGAMAPAFRLRDPSGKQHELNQYRGRIVVLDFWATWCQPCLATMPSLQALTQRFREEPVTILGLDTWDDGSPAEYMRSKGYTYTLLLEADDVAAHYGVEGLPTIVVIDEAGKVLAVHVGHDPELATSLGELIERRLAALRR